MAAADAGDQFVRLDPLGARENGPAVVRAEGAFQQPAVLGFVVVIGLAAPGEGRGPPAVGADPPRVDGAGRQLGVVLVRLQLFRAGHVGVGDLQRPLRRGVPGTAHRPAVELGRVEVVAVLVGFAAGEGRGFQLQIVVHPAEGGDAEDDVGRVEPVVGDRRLGAVHGAHAVHEGRRAEGGFAGIADVGEDRVLVGQRPGVAGGQLHHQLVRVLSIDQRIDPVRRLARRQQKGEAVLAHEGIGAEHGAQVQGRAVGEVAAGRAHDHAADEGLVVTARTVLAVIDQVEAGMPHDAPVAFAPVDAAVLGQVRLPGGAGGLAGHGPGAEGAGHGMGLAVVHVRHVVAGRAHAGWGHAGHVVSGMGIGGGPGRGLMLRRVSRTGRRLRGGRGVMVVLLGGRREGEREQGCAGEGREKTGHERLLNTGLIRRRRTGACEVSRDQARGGPCSGAGP